MKKSYDSIYNQIDIIDKNDEKNNKKITMIKIMKLVNKNKYDSMIVKII